MATFVLALDPLARSFRRGLSCRVFSSAQKVTTVCYSTTNLLQGQRDPTQVFDRHVKRLQRNRSILNPQSRLTDYLKDEVAQRVVDRILVGVVDHGVIRSK
jgi:tRNA A37 threonylcarbamoyladenosine dehydratase